MRAGGPARVMLSMAAHCIGTRLSAPPLQQCHESRETRAASELSGGTKRNDIGCTCKCKPRKVTRRGRCRTRWKTAMMDVLSTATQELPVTPDVRADARSVVEEAHDRSLGQVTITLDDGQSVQLPERLSKFVVALVESAAAGASLTTTSLPDELTTTVAAQILGVSRPTLMKMVAREDLPSKKVGTHTRLLRDDVLRFRRKRQENRALSVAALMAAGEDFD